MCNAYGEALICIAYTRGLDNAMINAFARLLELVSSNCFELE